MSDHGTGDGDREKITLEIPAEAKAILQDQDGFLWENVTEATFNTFGGERLTTPAAVDREIELLRRKRRNANERIQDATDEYQRCEQRIEALKRRREEMAESAESERDALDRLLQSMAEHGHNVYIGHGSVESLANKWFGGDEAAALDALKERSDDAEYNFAENRFEEPGAGRPTAGITLKSVGGDADD